MALKSISHLYSRAYSHFAPSTSVSSKCIDYSLSNDIIETKLPELEKYGNDYFVKLSHDRRGSRKFQMINDIRRTLNKQICDNEKSLIPIGSVGNLLFNDTSDLDLVLIPSNDDLKWKVFMQKFNNHISFRRNYMNTIASKIKKSGLSKQLMDLRYYARIPIIRFSTKTNVQVDIQFGNIEPIQSTLFIRTCVEYDERVKILIHWLMKRFEMQNLINSSMGKFSRYHINLLVLHFLQAMPNPILPNVIENCPWLSSQRKWSHAAKVLRNNGSLYIPPVDVLNESCIGVLVSRMIDYFSQVDFHTMAIDSSGNLLKRSEFDVSFELIDHYHTGSRCRVCDAANILNAVFRDHRLILSACNFDELFRN